MEAVSGKILRTKRRSSLGCHPIRPRNWWARNQPDEYRPGAVQYSYRRSMVGSGGPTAIVQVILPIRVRGFEIIHKAAVLFWEAAMRKPAGLTLAAIAAVQANAACTAAYDSTAALRPCIVPRNQSDITSIPGVYEDEPAHSGFAPFILSDCTCRSNRRATQCDQLNHLLVLPYCNASPAAALATPAGHVTLPRPAPPGLNDAALPISWCFRGLISKLTSYATTDRAGGPRSSRPPLVSPEGLPSGLTQSAFITDTHRRCPDPIRPRFRIFGSRLRHFRDCRNTHQ
jgi:hypothetical protein